MLRNYCEDSNLAELRNQAKIRLSAISAELAQDPEYGYLRAIQLDNNPLVTIKYPVLEYPSKITSHNFDKNNLVEGTLLGIKGQYLILDTGVLNMRKFAGYSAELLVS